MRIAYVSLHWPRTRHIGVGRKINEQLRIWQARGHTAKLFMHTSVYQPESELIPGEVFTYHLRPGGLGLVRNEYERALSAGRLFQAVSAFRPDVVYLRYGMYVYPIHRLAGIAQLIEEINTNDVSQHRELGAIYSIYNLISRGILLRRVRGLVCVSKELAVSPAFARFGKPTRVIANGIDVKSVKHLPAPENRRPRLVFIVTPGYFWHGVDKLVQLARNYPDLDIDLIGYHKLQGIAFLPDNLRLYGYLNADDYVAVLANADVALGTLALHRKDMNEASPLKTRECLAYGLPMVLPYVDTDLDTLECDFLLKIPNRVDNIKTHGDAIRDFAYRMRGRRAERKLYGPRIDSEDKESLRLTFFEQIVKNEKRP